MINRVPILILISLLACQPKYVEQALIPIHEYRDSRNGGVFTPKGDIRVLVVFAGFNNDANTWEHPGWAFQSKSGDKSPIPNWSDELFYSDSSLFKADAQDFTLSNYFYQMSNKQFRITADIFPQRININATTNNNRSWGTYGKMVMEELERHPEFENIDFKALDTRKNNPRYSFDNSSSSPDKEIDYVIICWRYNGVDPTGTTGLQRASGSGGGFAGISTYNFENGYRITSGFTICDGLDIDPKKARGLFVHEFSHSLFNNPHLFGANNVVGKYFYAGGGWAMTQNVIAPFKSANGWERWYLGWINPWTIKSPEDLPKKGVVDLDDFITTGQALRIKIPGLPPEEGNQYIWLENHAGRSNFDNREIHITNGRSEKFEPAPKGLLAYTECIADSFTEFGVFRKGANALRVIHAQGNYDYSWPNHKYTDSENEYVPGKNDNPKEWWGNVVYDFRKVAPNPLSGLNNMMKIRGNFLGSGFYADNDRIEFRDDNVNGAGQKRNEHYPVIMEEGRFVYGQLGTDLAFREGQEIGMGTNPTICNMPTYESKNNRLGPVYLNGLNIKVLKYLPDGKVRLKISFDGFEVKENVRWAGTDIRLRDINIAGYDLILKQGKVISIDKSGTVNRHTKLQDSFVNPTIFLFESNSSVKLESGSRIDVTNGSTLIIRKGSKVVISDGASINTMKGGKLVVEEGAEIIKEGSGSINRGD